MNQNSNVKILQNVIKMGFYRIFQEELKYGVGYCKTNSFCRKQILIRWLKSKFTSSTVAVNDKNQITN